MYNHLSVYITHMYSHLSVYIKTQWEKGLFAMYASLWRLWLLFGGIISLSYTKSLACGCSKEKKETINVIACVYATEFCMHDVIQTVNVAWLSSYCMFVPGNWWSLAKRNQTPCTPLSHTLYINMVVHLSSFTVVPIKARSLLLMTYNIQAVTRLISCAFTTCNYGNNVHLYNIVAKAIMWIPTRARK